MDLPYTQSEQLGFTSSHLPQEAYAVQRLSCLPWIQVGLVKLWLYIQAMSLWSHHFLCINQYYERLMSLSQGHYMAEIGTEPRTSLLLTTVLPQFSSFLHYRLVSSLQIIHIGKTGNQKLVLVTCISNIDYF